MEYLIYHEGIFKGENIIMGNNTNETNTNGAENNPLNAESYTIKRSTLKWFFGICLTFLGLCITFLSFVIMEIISLNRETSGIEDIRTNIIEINNGLNGDKGLYARLAVIENELDIDVSTINNSSDMFVAFMGEVSNKHYSANAKKYSLSSKIIIGEDTKGKSRFAEDYVNKTILLTYKDKADDMNVEVYFLGQYNENYHWDGFCVTNVYYSGGDLDGKLHEICESNFDDGKRLDFKSIHYNINEKDWLYSEREVKNDVNIGINKHYLFNYNKTKNFTSSNVKSENIMYVDSFIKNVDATMIKYYSGNTSDGYFNDSSGNAYRATYFKDENIESLYMGKFIDGYPNDATGNAWEIYYSPEDNSYVYCKGIFEDNEYKDEDKTLVSIDEINDLIKGYDFDCELKWKEN